MHLKNKISQRTLFLTALFVIIFALSGCAGSSNSFIEKEVNPQINVFDVQLFMDEPKVHEVIGSQGEKAMCVYGYEYTYADKNINIGFNAETQQARRVTTRNPDTSIFAIKPGTELGKVYEVLKANGFTQEAASKYRFHKENVIFSIISMHGTHADGITIEIDPDQKAE